MRLLFFVLLFLINMPAVCQTYSSITTDKEIVDFINWHVNNDKRYSEEPLLRKRVINKEISYWDSTHFIPGSSKNNRYNDGMYLFKDEHKFLDTIFTAEDKEFFFQQFRSQLDSQWQHSFKKAKQRIVVGSKPKKWRRYSLPLFSIDKNYVILMEDYLCGHLCGYRSINVYKRTKDGWELIYPISWGIS
ncbi:MAG: hypothetical protein K2Q24_12915 [Chitinophagaceae bacterium]|nr:hypothetical protein [Chitinophagaceae bacterium]